MLKDLTHRPRRLRRNPAIRQLVHEVDLRLSQLIQPYFLATSSSGKDAKEPIANFTDVYRWGVDSLSKRLESDLDRGLKGVLLFGSTDEKDDQGTGAYRQNNVVAEAIQMFRQRFGRDLVLFTDVCLCPFTSHGHCGVVKDGIVLNDQSVELLCRMALTHAQAGVDFVAPSDMMDGRIGAIRTTLDQKGFPDTGILSYTAKYRSNYYGPFREALDSAPQQGDRSSYQMDFRNRTDALRELRLDLAQGADLVMVKPALPYLDIIAAFNEHADVPVAAYCVSGEYEIVKQAAKSGLAEEKPLVLENLTAIKRAGAQLIITYWASEIAEKGWLK